MLHGFCTLDAHLYSINMIKGKRIEKTLLEFDDVSLFTFTDSSCKKTCYLTQDLNNITLKFTNTIVSCKDMFRGLGDIIEIDLSHFDTSEVISMQSMFRGCSKIISLDLSNLNTKKLKNISYMFCRCTNLQSIDFGFSYNTFQNFAILGLDACFPF